MDPRGKNFRIGWQQLRALTKAYELAKHLDAGATEALRILIGPRETKKQQTIVHAHLSQRGLSMLLMARVRDGEITRDCAMELNRLLRHGPKPAKNPAHSRDLVAQSRAKKEKTRGTKKLSEKRCDASAAQVGG